ncbi:MAG TPA: hypothetical protein VMM13_20005 [Euzebya sp.]|nr:hypothetical protein [Euzebya sp.]
MGHVCGDCGREDRLFERGRCAHCALAHRTTLLFGGEDSDVPDHLTGLRDAIVAAPQPRSALNWLNRGAAATLLGEVADGALAPTHEALDRHPQRGAAEYLRRLLVAHELLPDRDEDLARAHRWSHDLLAGVQAPAERLLVTTYANWRVLRRLRRRADATTGPRTPTAHARNQLAAAVRLLEWLHDHDRVLAYTTQDDIDTWLGTAGPGGHLVADFLSWAAEHRHCPRLDVASPDRATGSAMHPDQRWAILARLLHDDTLDLTDRLAGALLLCYAQPLARLAAMTTDQIGRHSDGTTTIRFGADPIVLPEPLATLLRTHLDTRRRHIGVGAPATSPWLFTGHLPGRPLTASRLGQRLGHHGIDARAARRAAMLHLAAQLPAAVLADLLNLSTGTAANWVNHAGGDWSRYAAAIADDNTLE